ncbi:hypothetical protein [Brevibacterium sp. p3-SID960]|nr:hypothetical protein [Brevibacterium sp. p3-SID960]
MTSRELAYVPPGSDQLTIAAAGDRTVRAALFGGPPLGGQIVM